MAATTNLRACAAPALALLAVGLSMLVFWPILDNYFWSDDFLVLHLFTNWPLERFLTMNWAGHLVIVRNAFYALVQTLAGPTPLPYYIVILTLHALNVALVFSIIHGATRSAALACLGAAMWGTCPLNEGSLGWIAASGNVVVATSTLLVIRGAERARVHATVVGVGSAALWAACLLIGAQSFGTGLGVAIGTPVVLLWWLSDRLTLAARLVLLATPLATAAMYGVAHTSEFSGDLGTSVLAKANFLFHLVALGVANLIRGLGYEPSANDFLARPVFDQPSAGLSLFTYSLIAAVTCLWIAAVVRASGHDLRRLIVAITIVALCNYGAIALGRTYFIDVFHQPILPWTGQPRYHYSSTALLAIVIAICLAAVRVGRLRVWAPAALGVWLAAFVVLYARSGWAIRHYDEERRRVETFLSRIDDARRAAPPGNPVFTYNETFHEAPHTPGAAALYVINRGADSGVYFVDRAAVTIYRDFPNSPLARVMLPPLSSDNACRYPYEFQSIAR